ncbi:hypothetical protein PFFVO_02446 [Plasmodium falciparum Vietnam Oak-Knoll (FVO)]|uniref:Uncharacterized protein n=1 Tax=Plasmodium falciparum Vietnam Oak-Knoll (FVO) TaxID=1036723 RepID=A0A024V7K6_PLAFA|nr:hypothetical protein PFFVO_02446 [Plasmodium falciparum Vietnam Oak-Knoll (FVO)]
MKKVDIFEENKIKLYHFVYSTYIKSLHISYLYISRLTLLKKGKNNKEISKNNALKILYGYFIC